MKGSRLLPLTILLTVMFFSACQKEPDFVEVKQEPASACRPVTVYAYGDNNTITDSATYEYANDKLAKATFDGDVITYEYTGNNVTKRSITESNTAQPYAYQLLAYGADGNVAKIESFIDIGFGFVKFDSTVFSYTNSKLAGIRAHRPSSSAPYAMALEEELKFTYTGNNITKLTDQQFFDGTPGDVESFSYTYDNLPNYFKKQTARFLQTDPIFLSADYYFYVFALSENNVTKAVDDNSPTDVENYSYTADAKGNLSEMRVQGELVLKYFYECK